MRRRLEDKTFGRQGGNYYGWTKAGPSLSPSCRLLYEPEAGL